MEDVLEVFNVHLSVERIRRNIKINEKFLFQQVKEDFVRKIVDIHLPSITKIINLSFENDSFPDDLKLAEVIPVDKQDDDLDKENYRPVSVSSHVSRVFKRIVKSN